MWRGGGVGTNGAKQIAPSPPPPQVFSVNNTDHICRSYIDRSLTDHTRTKLLISFQYQILQLVVLGDILQEIYIDKVTQSGDSGTT